MAQGMIDWIPKESFDKLKIIIIEEQDILHHTKYMKSMSKVEENYIIYWFF